MKKTILLLITLAIPLLALAEVPEYGTPIVVKDVYALKISPNGTWVGSAAGDGALYNTQTGETTSYSPAKLGLGNTVANNGMAVGDQEDKAAILYNGDILTPEALSGDNYWFCDIHAITPDATYICGIVNNETGDETEFIPFIASINPSNGDVSDVTMLPYPELDLFGSAKPQYCTAVWISNDAKTILGQVTDWRGMYAYPIVYTQDGSGKWSYTLPSESLFNPDHIEIPVNPWLDEPEYPEATNFMYSETAREAYLEAIEEYRQNALAQEPDARDYMTDEEWEEYLEAYTRYNAWYHSQEEKIKEYIAIYAQVVSKSPTFFDNEYALHPLGEFFMSHGGYSSGYVNEDSTVDIADGRIYRFGIGNNAIVTYEAPSPSYYPSQILPNGTTVITKGQTDQPSSYLMLPGSNTFTSMQEYLSDYPNIVEWMDEALLGTGVVSINDEMTIFAGGLVPDIVADYNANTDPYYSSYFLYFKEAGVESIIDEATDGVYRVYNLQGVKVLETQDASLLNSLSHGIYIVNGKKVYIK